MISLVRKILNILSKHSRFFHKYHLDWGLFEAAPLGLIIINFIFQRIFRVNSEADIPIHFTSRITTYSNIKLHKDKRTISSFLASGHCYIQAYNRIELGKNILFGPGVKIISANHDPHDYTKHLKDSPIKIGDNVWIGANAIILPGVEIGSNCIIGAGAVVTKSFKNKKLVIGGNPAREIKKVK